MAFISIVSKYENIGEFFHKKVSLERPLFLRSDIIAPEVSAAFFRSALLFLKAVINHVGLERFGI